jgi:hypothetical protein
VPVAEAHLALDADDAVPLGAILRGTPGAIQEVPGAPQVPLQLRVEPDVAEPGQHVEVPGRRVRDGVGARERPVVCTTAVTGAKTGGLSDL